MPRSLTPNGETDNTSLHGSCPTLKGEKWSATKWIHVGPFGGSSEAARAKWYGSLLTCDAMLRLRPFLRCSQILAYPCSLLSSEDNTVPDACQFECWKTGHPLLLPGCHHTTSAHLWDPQSSYGSPPAFLGL